MASVDDEIDNTTTTTCYWTTKIEELNNKLSPVLHYLGSTLPTYQDRKRYPRIDFAKEKLKLKKLACSKSAWWRQGEYAATKTSDSSSTTTTTTTDDATTAKAIQGSPPECQDKSSPRLRPPPTTPDNDDDVPDGPFDPPPSSPPPPLTPAGNSVDQVVGLLGRSEEMWGTLDSPVEDFLVVAAFLVYEYKSLGMGPKAFRPFMKDVMMMTMATIQEEEEDKGKSLQRVMLKDRYQKSLVMVSSYMSRLKAVGVKKVRDLYRIDLRSWGFPPALTTQVQSSRSYYQ